MKTKLLIIALALLMLLNLLASCNKKEESSEIETQPTDTVETQETSGVPVIDMENKEIKILHRTLGDCSFYDELMPSEDEEEDIVDAAMIQRNSAVENKHNVTLVSVAMNPTEDSFNQIQTWMAANQHFCDIVNWRAREVSSLATQGFLVEYSQLPYIDTDTNYWYQEILEDVSIANRTYFAANDMNLGTMVSTAVIYFNLNAYVDRGLSAKHGSLYTR